jgi:acetyl esterase/lipase
MKVYRLWDGDAPGALGNSDDDIPTLTDYGEPGTTGVRPACVVCPGGGYGMLAEHEGKPVAHWLESIGVRAFVLKYRLGPRYHHPAMLNDAERSIRYVRQNAASLGVGTTVGVLGFSAGGHLASTVSTHHSAGDQAAGDPVDRNSSRPDFSILLYPVVTMSDPFTHAGSRENLLGKNPEPHLIDQLSNERTVALDTPPTFLFHGADDQIVPIQNSLDYALALAGHKIPFEMGVPAHGPHGFGLGEPGSPLDWRTSCAEWLITMKTIA